MTIELPLTADELEILRNRLDAIDDGIIDLISERQNVVEVIGEHKLKTGPLRHFAREREVIERGMSRADSLGVSNRLARDILETLIHHSLGRRDSHTRHSAVWELRPHAEQVDKRHEQQDWVDDRQGNADEQKPAPDTSRAFPLT